MPDPAVPVRRLRAGAGRSWRAWFVQRWRSLTPDRQDRLATLAPLLSVVLFLIVMVAALWYLREEDRDLQQQAVRRDAELIQQQIRLRLIDAHDTLARMGRDLIQREHDGAAFQAAAEAFGATRPEVVRLARLGVQRESRSVYDLQGDSEVLPWPSAVWQPMRRAPATSRDAVRPDRAPTWPMTSGDGASDGDEQSDWAFIAARDLRMPMYSGVFRDALGQLVFEVHVPLVARGQFAGTLAADYAVDALLRRQISSEVLQRHVLSIVDARGRVLASTGPMPPSGASAPAGALAVEVPLAPAMNGLMLRVAGRPHADGLLSNTLLWMVLGLTVMTAWMLVGSWRHVRRRTRMQATLVQEANFRRAMEDSMLTGMRAIDLDGRITYVNPAFCAMTGFSEVELLDHLPPYPYWPQGRFAESRSMLEEQMAGQSPVGGQEAKLQRKDGTLIDVRMYVSPLIDPRGQQAGWVTSITNITEAKRTRDQLSASHERFTTVLEGLEAAVSVLSVQQGELLFANRSYRLWFGADAGGHALLADGGSGTQPYDTEHHHDDVDALHGLPAHQLEGVGATPREVWAPALDKWFDVRTRYLQWTDGSLAQMLIATDITARRQAEELAALQAEKAQVSSRLITMGEMASSVAHELNQPLTAITNYCNGMRSRLQSDVINRDDLSAALDKTARQAERAGQIIQRIRAFVKKSEPQRVPAAPATIVDDTLELAQFELRRRNVQIQHYVAHHLPLVPCDPILVEQVLLNLLKNAAESIDAGGMPPARRHIELRVVPRHQPEGSVIEFSVTDRGPGLPDEVRARLYEAFFSTKAEGLGIGLSLCRSIVESHKGRMSAANLYNGDEVIGCRFAFTLPLDPDAAGAAPRPDAPSAPASAPHPPAAVATPSATTQHRA